MPAPRAVLIDLHEMNLDPTATHTNLSKNGHIASNSEKTTSRKKQSVKNNTAIIESTFTSEIKKENIVQEVENEMKVEEHVSELVADVKQTEEQISENVSQENQSLITQKKQKNKK